jgi:tetratricopeptide (TPR) repeat protein
MKTNKASRNDFCACGSGKKFKHCCMKQVSENKESDKNMISDLMKVAIDLHQQGKLAEAEVIYQQVLQADQQHPDALHFLGVIAYQIGQYDTAVELITLAIQINPYNAFYFSNIGLALRAQEKYEEAEINYRQAIALKPDYAEAYLNLGVAQTDQGKTNEAVKSYRSAIEIKPDYAEAYSNLGAVLCDLDELNQSIISYQTAIALKPDFAQAHDNLGVTLRLQGNYSDAVDSHQRAISLQPNYVTAYGNLAATLIEPGKLDAAIACALKALEINPDYTEAYIYLGKAFLEKGNKQESLECSLRALELNPSIYDASYLLALTLLTVGNLEQGWKKYEDRFSQEHNAVQKRKFPAPRWEGQDLTGQTILVWGEQGVGDQIMFASMYAEIVFAAKHTIFACKEKLIPLFKRSFPDAKIIALECIDSSGAIEGISLKEINFYCPAGSLARWLRPTVNSFPRKDRFLTPDQTRVNHWKTRLTTLGPGLKIGICWRSGNMKGNRPIYCSSLDQWGPILSVPNVHFINLQYDECNAELDAASKEFNITIHHYPEVDLFDDIDESAALTSALDLVISAPTSTSILAAALGVPTWQILLGSDWQSFGTEENLWYSSLYTIRKNWDQSWEETIQKIAVQLQSKSQEPINKT